MKTHVYMVLQCSIASCAYFAVLSPWDWCIISSSPGLTFSLNGQSIPNNNVSRISVNDFTISDDVERALQCFSFYCLYLHLLENRNNYLQLKSKGMDGIRKQETR